ncbi:2,3-diaminopropionate biosynthesis protein SbnA [Ktedonobacteria bacterium brp13]|nr:2,3-diaminopropionate biosynthesis protein SbnA [Ktedonobacteria bacterium brp13]
MSLNQRNIADLALPKMSQVKDKVGATPMQEVCFLMEDAAQQKMLRRVQLKLEGRNPTGSMKDRTGIALIEYLEQQGRLDKESIIIESTSGNLGVALASQCKAKGYDFVAVIDPKTTRENVARMEALGAHLDMVYQVDANGGYLLSRLARVQELCSQNRRYVWTDQYSSPANPYIHYITTGPEIYRQMQGKVDVVFVPVSTGGTLAGIGRFFREVSPSTHVIGVDVFGSVVFEDLPALRKLTGIGSSRRSSFLAADLYKSYLLIHDEEAIAFCRALFDSTKMMVGGSSGAVLAACACYLRSHPAMTNIVCVCADNGENYASSIFNNEWIQQHGLYITPDHLGPVPEITLNA